MTCCPRSCGSMLGTTSASILSSFSSFFFSLSPVSPCPQCFFPLSSCAGLQTVQSHQVARILTHRVLCSRTSSQLSRFGRGQEQHFILPVCRSFFLGEVRRSPLILLQADRLEDTLGYVRVCCTSFDVPRRWLRPKRSSSSWFFGVQHRWSSWCRRFSARPLLVSS